MSNKSLMFRPPPPHIVTRNDPNWLDVPAAQTWQRNAYTPTSIPIDAAQYSTEQPVRVPSWGADVAVPIGQAVGTGVFIGVVSGVLAIWLGWAWQIPILTAAIGAAVIWFVTLNDMRALLRRVEVWTGKDLDRDGHIGPQKHTTEINVRIEQDGRGPRDLFLRFEGVRPEQLHELFKGALRGDSLSESKWTGAGKLFSKPKYCDVRDALLDAGLLRWQNEDAHAQGLSVTKSGKAVLQRWCDEFARTQAHALDGTEN